MALYRPFGDEDQGGDDANNALLRDDRMYSSGSKAEFDSAPVGHPPAYEKPADPAVAAKFHHIEDLDKFFSNAYEYYNGKGLHCVLATAFLNRLGILFVAFLFVVIFGCIDYQALYHHIHSPMCANETENTASLFEEDCYGFRPISFQNLGRSNSLVSLCLFAVVICWLLEMYRFVLQIPAWLEMRIFFEDVLRISPYELKSISWDSVLEKIVEVQKHVKLCITIQELDHENIVNMICRNDNFYLALFQTNWMAETFTLFGNIWFSMPMQWNIMRCINTTLFRTPHTLHEAVKNGSPADVARITTELKHSFRVYAVANLVLLPFIAVIRLAYFCFENSDEWKSRPASLSLRRFTPFARFLLRDYNEVSHIFEKRLRQCYEPAMNYVSLFVSEPVIVISRFAIFILGGFFLVILAFSVFFDDELLVATFFWNRSVAWWLTVLGWLEKYQSSRAKFSFWGCLSRSHFWLPGVSLAVFRAQLPAENAVFEPKVQLEKVQATSHAFHKLLDLSENNDSWRTYEKFAALFKLKVVVFLEELMGFFLTPYLLYFVLPNKASDIVAFFKANTSHVDGLGDICHHARFKEQAREIRSAFYGGDGAGNSTMDGQSVVNISPFQMQAKRKIMESMIHFKDTNPLWKPDAETQAMFDDMQELIDQTQPQAYSPTGAARGLQKSIIVMDQNPREAAAILQRRMRVSQLHQ